MARIPLTLPLMEIARTLISYIWTNCQLSLNAKGGGDLFECRQAVFQNGQPVENTLQKGPKFPSKGPSLLSSLIAWKMPGKFKTNGNQLKKKRKSKKHLFPEKQPYFFHLYIRAQTVSVSSGFCGGEGGRIKPIHKI